MGHPRRMVWYGRCQSDDMVRQVDAALRVHRIGDAVES